MRTNEPIIIDTSALFSLISSTDANYNRANEISTRIQSQGYQIIILSEVFAEFLNIVGKKQGHSEAAELGSWLMAPGKNENILLVDSTESIRKDAVARFRLAVGSVSYTDCLVMAAASVYKTENIFGFDDAFRKNGFIRFGVDEPEQQAA